MSDREEIKSLIETVNKIHTKINESGALNGKFDKLVNHVEGIQEKQEETIQKLDTIQTNLYEPNNGLFSRVKTVETSVISFDKTFNDHIKKDEQFQSDLLGESRKLSANISITKRLKEIGGGESLPEIEAAVKLRKILNKIMWLVAVGVTAEVGKIIVELFFKH